MHLLAKIVLVTTTIVMITLPVPVLASNGGIFNGVCGPGGVGNSSTVCQDNSTTNPLVGSNGLLLKISAVIALIAGVAAVIVILISGLSYITSGGDPAKAQRARGALVGALVGVVVIVLAESIIGFVLSRI